MRSNDHPTFRPAGHRLRRHASAAFLLFASVLVGARCTCGPSEARFGLVAHWDLEESFAFETPYPDRRVRFRARVYYPVDMSSEGFANPFQPPVADGLHPLLVFGHGRWPAGVPDNYLGMTNLMHHLASWGWICVSVDLDVLNENYPNFQHGIPHRGELLLHAVDRMLELNFDASSLFGDKIDAEKVVLSGHSRGGGGAISAANRNFQAGSPRSIRAVATISPVDFGTLPLQPPIPHLSIYGTWDGDLLNGDGHRIWDAGTREATKQFVQVYGANHFHFTDATTLATELAGISRERHQETAQGFINAFLALHVEGTASPAWNRLLVGDEPMVEGVNSWIQILSTERLAVDDAETGGGLVNSLGGVNESTLSVIELLATAPLLHLYNASKALVLAWNSEQKLVLRFAPQDVSGFDVLHFRASQAVGGGGLRTPTPEEVDKFKDWKVHLRDANGESEFVGLRGLQGGLMYPDFSETIAALQEESPDENFDLFQRKSIPRSFRIPLDSFGIDLTNVTEVEFEFDLPDDDEFVNTKGSVVVDDVEFVSVLENVEEPQ
ncbi:MAG: hypothetical protein ABFS41_05380 [Myxococcota bacterium]